MVMRYTGPKVMVHNGPPWGMDTGAGAKENRRWRQWAFAAWTYLEMDGFGCAKGEKPHEIEQRAWMLYCEGEKPSKAAKRLRTEGLSRIIVQRSPGDPDLWEVVRLYGTPGDCESVLAFRRSREAAEDEAARLAALELDS